MNVILLCTMLAEIANYLLSLHSMKHMLLQLINYNTYIKVIRVFVGNKQLLVAECFLMNLCHKFQQN